MTLQYFYPPLFLFLLRVHALSQLTNLGYFHFEFLEIELNSFREMDSQKGCEERRGKKRGEKQTKKKKRVGQIEILKGRLLKTISYYYN